eukprot:9167818-Alexandrium_andersonii.AAC.1
MNREWQECRIRIASTYLISEMNLEVRLESPERAEAVQVGAPGRHQGRVGSARRAHDARVRLGPQQGGQH